MRSARKHRVGKRRALDVIEDPFMVIRVTRTGQRDVLLDVGDDHTGRALEVGVVEEDDALIVVHVMDLRHKYRAAYEQGKGSR